MRETLFENEAAGRGYRLVAISHPDLLVQDLTAWLEAQPPVGDPAWLLAFTDEGVVWGELRAGKLALSGQAFPDESPALLAETLQQAYLFGDRAEVRVWRDGNSLRSSRTEDQPIDAAGFSYDEAYVLWGTQVEQVKDRFWLMSDGRQGLLHAVPLEIERDALDPDHLKRPLRLAVRHYAVYEPDHGQASWAASRLLGLVLRKEK